MHIFLTSPDLKTQKQILDRIQDHLSQDPVSPGEPLKEIFRGLYYYHYGDERITYALDHGAMTVMILRIAKGKRFAKISLNQCEGKKIAKNREQLRRLLPISIISRH